MTTATIAERTPITTFGDILNAMARNPELKEQMRQHLQDEELRNLPQTVARLVEAVAELTVIVQDIAQRQERTEADVADIKAGQAQHNADIAELKDSQTRLEDGQARLEAGQARLQDNQRRMQSDINRLSGSDYERRVARTLRRNSLRHFGIRNGQLVHSVTIPNNNHLPDLLDLACSQAAIAAHEADHADQTDIVIHGQDGDNQPTYAVIEASVTIENHDIIRARERADIISRAAGAPAIAAACGSRIADETGALAGQYDVTVIILPA